MSVLRGHSVFFIPAATTANDLRLRRIFYPRCYPLHLFSYLNSWDRASMFPFECSVLNQSTTGIIFITSLVWRGPWLGIEPGTFRTRSQHYTTRLSRRRWRLLWKNILWETRVCAFCWNHTYNVWASVYLLKGSRTIRRSPSLTIELGFVCIQTHERLRFVHLPLSLNHHQEFIVFNIIFDV